MRKRKENNVAQPRIIAIPREEPDLDRLVAAALALAVQRLEKERKARKDKTKAGDG
jgi:hypothetical protein